MSDKQMDAYYGKDQPSASFKWGVIVPVVTSTLLNRTDWRALAWFKTRKRAEQYANSGWSNYAIARMK